ncbi:MAG: hypothetical protein H6851_13245 [Geminicoccaceae bacterium]|nr:hypothetical protein [Geminicoccaceae bacterium]
MMFGERLEIGLKLKLLSDLHIGSGHFSQKEQLGDPKDDGIPEFSEIVRDSADCPVLTSTGLKGALRQATRLELEEVEDLLGKSGNEPGDSNIARLWIGMFRVDENSDGQSFELAKEGCLVDHGYIRTGNAINRKTGSVDDKKLYNQEWIEADPEFGGRLTLFWEGKDAAERDALIVQVASLLAPLWSPDGLAIGADRRHGAGRLVFEAMSCTAYAIDVSTLSLVPKPSPDVERRIAEIASKPCSSDDTTHRAKLRLICDGPFISIRAKVPEGEDNREVTKPLRRNGRPHLWPSSFLGSLRSAASWFAELEQMRSVESEEDDVLPCDDMGKTVVNSSELSKLTSTERLFGVSGWRGLIRVDRLEPVGTSGTVCLKSVSIDRFTGGAMDQRLFTEEVFENVTFELDLSLDPARSKDSDATAFRKLVNQLTDGHILELGHGGSKGFGWFTVEAC